MTRIRKITLADGTIVESDKKQHKLSIDKKPIDITIEEAVKDLPDYNPKDAYSWIGSKEQYRSLFEGETNRSVELQDKFEKLHTEIVNMVIRFCEENGLEDVDSFSVSADGLSCAYGKHMWTPAVDTSMTINKEDEEEGDKPFLFEI